MNEREFSGRIEENYRRGARESVLFSVSVKRVRENEQGKYRKKSRKKVSSVCVEKKEWREKRKFDKKRRKERMK